MQERKKKEVVSLLHIIIQTNFKMDYILRSKRQAQFDRNYYFIYPVNIVKVSFNKTKDYHREKEWKFYCIKIKNSTY